jgi:hypothetical protein
MAYEKCRRQENDNPTTLARALTELGRIIKSLHSAILVVVIPVKSHREI